MTKDKKHKNKGIPVDGMSTMLMGYNVISGVWGSSKPGTLKAQLFDQTKFPMQTITHNQQEYTLPTFMTVTWPTGNINTYHEGTSAQSYSNSLSVSIDGSGTYEGFKGSMSSSFTETEKQSSDFIMATQRDTTTILTLTCQADADLRPYLSDLAREAIDGTGNTPLSPQELINNYGSHFLTGGVFGGYVEISASAFSKNVSDTTDIRASMSASYAVLTSASASTTDQTTNTAFRSDFQVTTQTVGGDLGLVGTSADTFDQAHLQKWIATVADKPTLIAFDPPTGSTGSAANDGTTNAAIPAPLAPIWALCSDPTRAAAIQAEFESMISTNPYSDGITFVGANQFVRNENPLDMGAGEYQQLVVTANPDFLNESNPQGDWTVPPSNQFSGYYVATSGPTSGTPTDKDVVPVYGYLLDSPTDNMWPAGSTGVYAYTIDPHTMPFNLYPHASEALPPVALPNQTPVNIVFYAFETQVSGTVPIYQYSLYTEVLGRDGPTKLYRYSMKDSLESYNKSNDFITNPFNRAKCVAFYAYPVIAP